MSFNPFDLKWLNKVREGFIPEHIKEYLEEETDVFEWPADIYDESVFRFVVRMDGQPAHSSAITPYKGSNSLSAFINLATRSS